MFPAPSVQESLGYHISGTKGHVSQLSAHPIVDGHRNKEKDHSNQLDLTGLSLARSKHQWRRQQAPDLESKMPYTVDDIIEEHHSPASDKADCTGNQQHSRLWLIAAGARRLRACACAVPNPPPR